MVQIASSYRIAGGLIVLDPYVVHKFGPAFAIDENLREDAIGLGLIGTARVRPGLYAWSILF